MTVRVPRMPMVFRLRCLIAASTSGMALTIGKAEIALELADAEMSAH